jgi:hypothetical protein
MAQKKLFPEADEIIAKVRSGERQDLVILIVPSHDKHNKELGNQDIWAEEALLLIGRLFGGATAFLTHSGVYWPDGGEPLRDKPILIESYVAREKLEDKARLIELLAFAKRMGHETRQQAVAIIVNDVFHEITEY